MQLPPLVNIVPNVVLSDEEALFTRITDGEGGLRNYTTSAFSFSGLNADLWLQRVGIC